jgi:hypothetical protein
MELYPPPFRYLRYPRRSHAQLCLFRKSSPLASVKADSQCVMIALIGVGAGGNLPVDGTMFLEFIPGNKQYLLTFLSIWWALGQVVASLIAVSSPSSLFNAITDTISGFSLQTMDVNHVSAFGFHSISESSFRIGLASFSTLRKYRIGLLF